MQHIFLQINAAIIKYYNYDPWIQLYRILFETYDEVTLFENLYLNGNFPNSTEEWDKIGGKTRESPYIITKMTDIMKNESPLGILRNKRMAAEMIRLMKENKDKGFFFAVGVSHLTLSTPKSQNILDHLEADGFHIERVWPGEILTGVPRREEADFHEQLLLLL